MLRYIKTIGTDACDPPHTVPSATAAAGRQNNHSTRSAPHNSKRMPPPPRLPTECELADRLTVALTFALEAPDCRNRLAVATSVGSNRGPDCWLIDGADWISSHVWGGCFEALGFRSTDGAHARFLSLMVPSCPPRLIDGRLPAMICRPYNPKKNHRQPCDTAAHMRHCHVPARSMATHTRARASTHTATHTSQPHKKSAGHAEGCMNGRSDSQQMWHWAAEVQPAEEGSIPLKC